MFGENVPYLFSVLLGTVPGHRQTRICKFFEQTSVKKTYFLLSYHKSQLTLETVHLIAILQNMKCFVMFFVRIKDEGLVLWHVTLHRSVSGCTQFCFAHVTLEYEGSMFFPIVGETVTPQHTIALWICVLCLVTFCEWD